MNKNLYWSSRVVPIILDRFCKKKKIIKRKFHKYPSLRAGLFHADRWTDTRKLIVAFSNFVRATINELLSTLCHGNVLLSAHTLSSLEKRLTLQYSTTLL